MITARYTTERKFTFLVCSLFIVVLNLEVFIFLTEFQRKNNSKCDSRVNIIYPYKTQVRIRQLADVLLAKWGSANESQSVVISLTREVKNGIVIVIPFLENGNSKDLLETIFSISNHTKEDEKLSHVLVVLFDSHSKHYGLIQKIFTEFLTDISIGFLQLVKEPFTISNDPICNQAMGVGKSSKQDTYRFLCLVSATSAYLSTQGSYVLFMNEDIEILNNGFLSDAMKFTKKLTKPWSILDFSDHMSGGFTGKLIRKDDLIKFTFFFIHLFSQPLFADSEKALYHAHLDYTRLMYQSNFISFRPNTMIRRSQIASPLRDHTQVHSGNGKWRSNDPPGITITNMQAIDFKHSAMRAYGSLPNQYFEAKISKYGDWFAIVFDEEVHLEKVIIDLDYKETAATSSDITTNNFIGNDTRPVLEGILEASSKLVTLDIKKNRLTCGDYKFIGNVRGSSTVFDDLEDTLVGRPTKCLKLTLSVVHPINNFVIKQLAVFAAE